MIHGRRGSAIDRALAAYAGDAAGQATRTVTLDDGATLDAGGAAQIVLAYTRGGGLKLGK